MTSTRCPILIIGNGAASLQEWMFYLHQDLFNIRKDGPLIDILRIPTDLSWCMSPYQSDHALPEEIAYEIKTADTEIELLFQPVNFGMDSQFTSDRKSFLRLKNMIKRARAWVWCLSVEELLLEGVMSWRCCHKPKDKNGYQFSEFMWLDRLQQLTWAAHFSYDGRIGPQMITWSKWDLLDVRADPRKLIRAYFPLFFNQLIQKSGGQEIDVLALSTPNDSGTGSSIQPKGAIAKQKGILNSVINMVVQ